jgi:hypothetical protein
MAVSDGSGSFCSAVEETEGADDAVEDVIFQSPSGCGHEAQHPDHTASPFEVETSSIDAYDGTTPRFRINPEKAGRGA